ALPLDPEWYLVVLALACVAALGASWPPLMWAWLLLIVAVALPLAQAGRSALGVSFGSAPGAGPKLWKRGALTTCLYLLQPLERLIGRMRHGLTFYRRRATTGYALPRPWTANLWTRSSLPVDERLQSIEAELRHRGWVPLRGGECDHWDLEVR